MTLLCRSCTATLLILLGGAMVVAAGVLGWWTITRNEERSI